MRILRKGGVLEKPKGKEESWRNVSEHCLVEAVAADVLAEHLHADREKVVQAALLHDWYKRREIEGMKKKGGGEGYAAALEEDGRLLLEYGVPQELVDLAHANFPKSADPDYLKNRTLEEKIMYYVDIITSDSEIVPFEERLKLAKGKKNIVEMSEWLRGQYGGKSFFELHEILAPEVQTEFEDRLGIEHGTLVDFIKQKIEERIG